jgi:roadblock/LC7 domain-containing protein
MGLFKNMRDLSKQGRELQKNMDVGAQLENAQAQMAAANEMMAQQTAAANAATTGVDATAVIVEVRQGAAMINYQPMIEVDLTVMPEGLPPYPVTVQQVATMVQLPEIKAGATVHVKVDPNNPSAVWIDWTRIT